MAEVREKLILEGDNSDLVKKTKEAEAAVDALGKEGQSAGAQTEAAFDKTADGAKKAKTEVDPLTRSMESLASSAKALVIGEALGLAGQAFGALKQQIEETVKTGLDYNKMMQDSKAGLGALILANYELKDASGNVLEGQAKLQEAFKQASDLQKELAKDANKTSAEYEDLVKAFQAGLAPALQAGVKEMDQLRAIMLAASQAAKVLGVEGNQLSQEMGALFRFEKGPDNKLANALELTGDKLKELKANGEDVGAFLLNKLQPYAAAAAASMDNFSVSTSNLNAAIKEAAGELTKPLFEVLSAAALNAQKQVKDVSGQLKDTGQDLATMGKNVEPVAASLVKMGAALTALGASAGAALSPVAKYFVAIADAVTAMSNALGPIGMEAIGRMIATQFGVIIPESTGKAKKGIDEVGMAASHLPAAAEGIKLAASHATTDLGKIGDEADDAREKLIALDIQMSKAGDKPGGPSQMDGTLWQNIDAANLEQEAIQKLMDKRTQAHELHMRQMDAEANRNKQAQEDHIKKMDQAQAEIDAAGQLTQYEEGSIKFKGQLKIINMQLAEATEAVTKSLLDQVKAFDELNKKQEEHNSLMDYAANLLNAYQTGYTDLITSMNRVSETLQQLRAILMHNMNTPFEATIREWIKAFEDLQKTIAEGGKGPGPMKVF